MKRAGALVAVLLLPLAEARPRETPRVRSEAGRFWIECRSAPLDELLREIAAVAPIELWLDEGLSGQRVSVSVEGATMKEALLELFEEVNVNYVFYFDSSNPERVTKIYAGSGGSGRMGRAPSVEAAEVEIEGAPELPPELDPETLLDTPEAREALGLLQQFLERQDAAAEEVPDEATSEPELPSALRELLQNVPDFPRSPFTPGLESQPPGDEAQKPKEEKKPSLQL